MKKLLALLLALSIVFALVACSGSDSGKTKEPAEQPSTGTETPPAEAEAPAAEGDKPVVTYINPSVGSPVYEQLTAGVMKGAEDYGITVNVVGIDNAMGDGGTQYTRLINDAITMGTDGLFAYGYVENFDLMKSAADAGVAVVAENDWNRDYAASFLGLVGLSNEAYGEWAAEQIHKKIGGEANVCLMTTDALQANQAAGVQGVQNYADKHDDFHITVIGEDKAMVEQALPRFQEIYQAYPELNGVIMFEGNGPYVAAQVAEEMGLSDKITILGIDGTAETLAEIEKGTMWATGAQNFYARGYTAMRLFGEYFSGENTEMGRFYNTGAVLIDQSNAATADDDLWAAVWTKDKALPDPTEVVK